mmetsp:Transcript_174176/g.558516  ORF Transcript_174176/g.558516 Transcript_174176/m.558516 type:complete len:108 (+) Transcript_174176:697-1020(+)
MPRLQSTAAAPRPLLLLLRSMLFLAFATNCSMRLLRHRQGQGRQTRVRLQWFWVLCVLLTVLRTDGSEETGSSEPLWNWAIVFLSQRQRRKKRRRFLRSTAAEFGQD